MPHSARLLALLPFVAVVLAALPAPAFAQDRAERAMNLGIPSHAPAARPVARPEASPASPPIVVAHDGTARAIAPVGAPTVGRGDVLGRVAAEASVELLTVGALGVVPGLVAGLSAQPCPAGAYVCMGPDFFAAFFGAIGGTIALAFTPFFVSLAGEAVGGRGSAGAAYLGMLAGGALAAGALALGVAANDRGTLDAMLVVGGLCALAGPILGYEVSDGDARGARASGMAWMPTVGASQNGATIGVIGML